MASAEPRVLLLDADKERQKKLAEIFNASGLFLRYLSDPARLLSGCRQMNPSLLLVAGELRGEPVRQALSALKVDVTYAKLPVALLCEDQEDAALVSQLRTGVVALLPRNLPATALVSRVHALLKELPERTGRAKGRGDSLALANLAEHLRRTYRSGAITFNPGTPSQGRALFLEGQLQSASFQQARGMEALLKLVAQPSAAWQFEELSGAAGEGIGAVLTLEDEPLVPIVESRRGEVDGVLVPLEGADELVLNAEDILEPEPAPAPEPPAPISLLLVDDDEELCRMFGLLFRKHGYEVTVASDGLQGFEAAQAREFDLVVADLNMPRMDGWGLLRLLRDDFRTRELPVAFLSCHDDYRDSLKALNAGAQAYFSKSTRLDALATKVRALLDGRRRFLHDLETAGPKAAIAAQLSSLGPQWVLRAIARAGASCRIDTADGWASYSLHVRAGQPVHAAAKSGRHHAEGERAFNAFIACRAAESVVELVDAVPKVSLTGTMEEQLQRAAATLNENERKLREALLVNASEIQVDPDLYAVYAQVGPKQWLEAARLLCEERLAPREVISRVEASPLDVEETLKDLVRRGVIRLRA